MLRPQAQLKAPLYPMLLGPMYLLGSRELRERSKDSSLGPTCRLSL